MHRPPVKPGAVCWRSRLRRACLLGMLLAAPAAQAVDYSFPGRLPAGCTDAGGGSYTCPGSALVFGDTLTINTPLPATITVRGDLSTDNAQINARGTAANVTLVVTGRLTPGYGAHINANVQAASVNGSGAGSVTWGGSITTGTGALALGYGNVVAGHIASGSGDITVAGDSRLAGNVTSDSGGVKLEYGTQVTGGLATQGSISLAGANVVGGNITGATGDVTVGYGSRLAGVSTSSGSINLAGGGSASACVSSSGSARISLEWATAVNSVCCGGSCSNSCVANGSGLAMPPSCSAPKIASGSQTCGYPATARVTFAEPMDKASAETAGNYAVSGNTVSAASLSSDQLTVTLSLGSPLTSRQTVTVNNVRDLAGNPIASGSTTTVDPATTYPGLIGTYYAQDGKRGAAFAFTGVSAQRIDRQVNFGWASGPPGVAGIPADGFSVRWTGFIKTDTAGSYGFGTRSDDGVRLWVDSRSVVSNWTDHGATLNVGTLRYSLAAGSAVPVTMEYYENGGFAVAELRWQLPGVTGTTSTVIPAANLFNCVGTTVSTLASYAVTPASTSGSTCAASTVLIQARDSGGAVLTGHTGSIRLSTSSGRGTWALGSGPAPSGTLLAGSDTGIATYTFAAGDSGAVKLTLAHGLAQNVTVSVTDGSLSASGSAIQFRDNAFVFAEDLLSRVSGSDVAVAGRPHDFTLSLIKKDPATGSCGVASTYTGIRNLKFWRTDTGGSFTAPSVVLPALSVPAAQPAANNLTLAFTAGVASFNLGSTNIGRYALNVLDDSLSAAATSVSGSSNVLTVRPFALLVQGLTFGSTANPAGSAATDAVFAPAGASFSATVSAQLWSAAMLTNGADAANAGAPALTATLAALSAGGRATGFASAVTLAPLAGSQTPAGGTLGVLNNGSIAAAAFSGGAATASTLQYTEVGSFQLATSGLVSNFLGSGLNLDATVVNGAGTQSTRVGRFRPASLALSAATVTHRVAANCPAPSAFTYLDENFQLGFTLSALNALGTVTRNYTGSFARLDLATPASFGLVGLAGSTAFNTASSPARLSLGSSSGSWANGVASGVALRAAALRGGSPDGPFDVVFGIAPNDADGTTLASFDMAGSPGGAIDHRTLATVPLRFGRLRLSSAIGAADRALLLPVSAEHWNGTAFGINTLDSCTTVPTTAVSFGNLRRWLTVADTAASVAVTLSGGSGKLSLAAPQAGRRGTVDVALSLGSSATDASCLQPWTTGTGDAATASAGLPYLRGAWCGSTHNNDPAARATFGLQRGNDTHVYRREMY